MENFENTNISDESIEKELKKFLVSWLDFHISWQQHSPNRTNMSDLSDVIQWKSWGDSILHNICDGQHYRFYVPDDINHDTSYLIASAISSRKEYAPYNLSLADKIIELLLKNGMDVNSQNNQGNTPLHALLKFSIFEQDTIIKIIKLFIQNKVEINIRNKYGETLIFTLCYNLKLRNSRKNFELIKLLIDNNADCNINTNSGETPLSIVCKNLYYNMVNDDLYHDINLINLLINMSNENTLQNAYDNIQEPITRCHAGTIDICKKLKSVTYLVEIAEIFEERMKQKPKKEILYSNNDELDSSFESTNIEKTS
jgi:ankyrin repeat protein